MPASFASEIEGVLPKTRDAYYKLILAVGPAGSGKTAGLIDLATRHGWPRLNVNLRLAEHLLDLTQRQRAARVANILDEIIREASSDVALLDNIELLFAKDLAQDPLRLLQILSRSRTIVAAWPGNFHGGFLTYAEPSHPEARRYPTPQVFIVQSANADQSEAGSAVEDQK